MIKKLNILKMFSEQLIKQDVYIISTDCSNQSCIHDDLKTLKDELESFEFSMSEIHIITTEIKNMKYNIEKHFGNNFGYSIKIRKSKMTTRQIKNLPEFNGW
jgi:hypothetical protein